MLGCAPACSLPHVQTARPPTWVVGSGAAGASTARVAVLAHAVAVRRAGRGALGTSRQEIKPCRRQPSRNSHDVGSHTTSGAEGSGTVHKPRACARSFQPRNKAPDENGSTSHVRSRAPRSSPCLRQLLRGSIKTTVDERSRSGDQQLCLWRPRSRLARLLLHPARIEQLELNVTLPRARPRLPCPHHRPTCLPDRAPHAILRSCTVGAGSSGSPGVRFFERSRSTSGGPLVHEPELLDTSRRRASGWSGLSATSIGVSTATVRSAWSPAERGMRSQGSSDHDPRAPTRARAPGDGLDSGTSSTACAELIGLAAGRAGHGGGARDERSAGDAPAPSAAGRSSARGIGSTILRLRSFHGSAFEPR